MKEEIHRRRILTKNGRIHLPGQGVIGSGPGQWRMPKLVQVEALLAVHQSFRRVLIRVPNVAQSAHRVSWGNLPRPSLTPIVPHPNQHPSAQVRSLARPRHPHATQTTIVNPAPHRFASSKTPAQTNPRAGARLSTICR